MRSFKCERITLLIGRIRPEVNADMVSHHTILLVPAWSAFVTVTRGCKTFLRGGSALSFSTYEFFSFFLFLLLAEEVQE